MIAAANDRIGCDNCDNCDNFPITLLGLQMYTFLSVTVTIESKIGMKRVVTVITVVTAAPHIRIHIHQNSWPGCLVSELDAALYLHSIAFTLIQYWVGGGDK